jgi:PAS domain S-box-containing protein
MDARRQRESARPHADRAPDPVAGRLPTDPVEYQRRLRFETLLANLSSRFCGLAARDVDREIETAQRQVCEQLALDLCAVWQIAPDGAGDLVLTHLYRAQDGPAPPTRMEASAHFPWSLQQVESRRTVVLGSRADFPPEGARDLESWRTYGVHTTVTIPLAVGDDAPFGAVSFNDVLTTERRWDDALVQRLQLVAEVFANAIVRKNQDQALRRSEARLNLAADAAGAGIWSLDPETHQFWITERTRRLFGYTPDEVVTWQRFVGLVHADDHELLHETLAAVLETQQGFAIEYRVRRPDGEVRWMASRGGVQRWRPDDPRVMIMGVTVDVTDRKELESRLHEALDELQVLRDRLQNENVYLRSQIRQATGHGAIVGESEPVQRMLQAASDVAGTDSAVLITGETGTGKELLAQLIHDWSARKGRTMVKVNCAALPAPLIESELFGRERGAYTGAMTRQVGRFEVADGSTILLDEIGDLPLELQAKLLRVLEDGTFERLGSSQVLNTDARIIAATNHDLAAMVERGEFRADLFHRLNVFPLAVPPLRERSGDIPLLVWKFVEDFNRKMGRSIESIPRDCMERIKAHAWPGNVRELRNVIERAMILSRGRSLELELPDSAASAAARLEPLVDLERRHIVEVLEHVNWRISGTGGAAEILGMVPTTLHSRMKKLGIARPR